MENFCNITKCISDADKSNQCIEGRAAEITVDNADNKSSLFIPQVIWMLLIFQM